MERNEQISLTRREILQAFLAMPASLLLAGCVTQEVSQVTAPPAPTPTNQEVSQATTPPAPTPTDSAAAEAAGATATPLPAEAAPTLPATPACDDDDEPTLAQTEGPYYTPNTPQRNSLLEPDMVGTKLIVAGYVLATDCQPVAQALVDFWHCDDGGVYDNEGYRLRGHQFTDDQGHYYLETIVPGLYTGRTRHIHVKVQAPNQPILTTQMYFPDEPANANDGIFRPELVMDVQDASDGKVAAFNFVLDIA